MIDKDIFDFVAKGKGIQLNTPDVKTLGLYLANGPTEKVVGEEEQCNQLVTLNFTGPPGTASALYYGLVFWMNQEGWEISKMNEWIEVSPVFQEYYQRTVATKRQLEAQIKEGLTSAASAVADYELVEHDLRKYKDILGYFAEEDEHSLRAMFIDQVDVHTGAMALIQMAKRWPTIIADFQRLGGEDSIDAVSKKLKEVGKAEAVVLTTKNKLYLNWKKNFKDTVVKRYETLSGLAKARQKSVEEYRNWLKPYITRYKMTKLGGESSVGRANMMKSFADIAGTSTFTNNIQLVAWKALKPLEVKQREFLKEEKEGGFIIHPYDPWIRENMILNDKTGLAELYPWLKGERMYCPACGKYYPSKTVKCKCGKITESRTVADEIIENEIIPTWKSGDMHLRTSELYYTFLTIDVFRAGSRLPVGEVEDITFSINTYAISQNVLLVKLLELKCREREFDMYIDEILGIRVGETNVVDIAKRDFPELFEKPKKQSEFDKIKMDLKKISDQFGGFFKKGGSKTPGKFMFFKPGPYESDFKDRITKFYLAVTGKDMADIKNFLKSKMGVA